MQAWRGLCIGFFNRSIQRGGFKCLGGHRKRGDGKLNLSAPGSRGLEALGLRQRRAKQQAAGMLTLLDGMQRMAAWLCGRNGFNSIGTLGASLGD